MRITLALLLIAGLLALGLRFKGRNNDLATIFFTLAGAVAALLLAGLFGWAGA